MMIYIESVKDKKIYARIFLKELESEHLDQLLNSFSSHKPMYNLRFGYVPKFCDMDIFFAVRFIIENFKWSCRSVLIPDQDLKRFLKFFPSIHGLESQDDEDIIMKELGKIKEMLENEYEKA